MSARPAPLAGFRRVLLLAGLFMMLVQIHRASGAVIAAELAARGLPPSDIATVVSALFLAAALFQLPTGIAFDRYGARATLCGMGLVGVAGIVLFALSDDVLGLALGRFLIGLGHGGTIAGIYLLALTWVPPDRVSTMTGGVVAIAGGAGGVLATAPLVLALAAFGHEHTYLAVAAATLVVTLAIGLFVTDAPAGREPAATGRGETFRESLRGLWAVASERRMWPLFAMGTCFSLPFNTIGGLWAGPYLLDVHALGKATVSYALLAMVAAFHLGNLLYGPVERRLASRKRAVAGGAVLMIALLVLLAAWPRPPVAPAIVLLVVFCLCTPFYPVLAAHCRGFVPLGRAGRAIACVNLMGLTTVFAVQKLTGWLVEATATADGTTTLLGYRIVFVTVAAVLALGLWGYSKAEDVAP